MNKAGTLVAAERPTGMRLAAKWGIGLLGALMLLAILLNIACASRSGYPAAYPRYPSTQLGEQPEAAMPKLLVMLSILAFLDGSSATGKPIERVAQPQEKLEERSLGARLTFRETSRRASADGEIVNYALQADGLPQGKSYSVTGKWMNGRIGVIKALHIDGSGRVLTEDGEELSLVLARMFPGEFIEFTLAADDGTAKASVEIVLYPIEAVGNGGCRLSIKPMSINGQIFQISGSGFKPDQKIEAVATSDGEVAHPRWKTKSDGSLNIVVFPAVVRKSGGEASLTASDTSCSVTVRYHWGSAMTRAAPERKATPSAPLPATPAGQPATQSGQPAEAPTPEPINSSVEEVKVEAQQPCKNVNAPTLIYHVDPEYPEAARKKRLEGKVVLEAILTADGNVEDIKVLSSPSETLTRVAIQAFSRWRYKPASCEGKPIRVYLTTTTTFSLDGRPKGRH